MSADPKGISTTRFNEILGRKIKLLREIKGMDQMDLAYALGYNSSGMISLIERGVRGMSKKRIAAAAEVFGVHESILYDPHEYTERQLRVLINLTELMKRCPDNNHIFTTIETLLETFTSQD